MENRVVFRKRDGKEWAEVILVGRRAISAKVSMNDLDLISDFRWGWHPRGVFDHRKEILMVYILCPGAKRVGFRNHNLLDCRRENLLAAADEEGLCDLLRRRIVRTGKKSVTGIEGVYFDDRKCAYTAHIKVRGVIVSAFFDVRQYGSAKAAKAAAVAQRAGFLKMSYLELMQFKAGHEEACEQETWLGENVSQQIAARVSDPVEAAYKGYQAGLLVSRIISDSHEPMKSYGSARRNGRELITL